MGGGDEEKRSVGQEVARRILLERWGGGEDRARLVAGDESRLVVTPSTVLRAHRPPRAFRLFPARPATHHRRGVRSSLDATAPAAVSDYRAD